MNRRTSLRIGYLNQDFPPEVGAGPARVAEMSLFWQQAGAHVTVITGMPNRRMPHLEDGQIHPDYRGKLFLEENWKGIRVLRSWLFSSRRRSFAMTLLNNASFMITAAAHALMRAGSFDVLIASSPPFLAHPAGELFRMMRRVPLVLEIRDLWPDYMVELGMLKNTFAKKALFGLEDYLLRHGQHTVVVTESFRERLIAKGVSADRIDVVSNGVDTEFYYADPHASPPLPELVKRNNEFVVGYLGNFGAGQEIRTVVEAAAQLRTLGANIRFVLAGDGKEKNKVVSRWRELGVDNISIHPPIPKEQTRAFYNCCDLCLVPLAPVPIFSETVPSKIFEVMACERPVLASVAGEASRIVEKSRGGFISPPGDAALLAEAILKIHSMSSEQRMETGRRGREYVSQHYSRESLASRYLGILERIAAPTLHSDSSVASMDTAAINRDRR